MKNLLFFSSNQNKIIEIKKIFKIRNQKILSLNDLPKIKTPKETGKKFVDNAKIKSLYGFKKFNIQCFADDSGICISALNNKPGVHSKRFAGEDATDHDRITLLLSLLNNYPAHQRTAQFRCCLVFSEPKKITGPESRSTKEAGLFTSSPVSIENASSPVSSTA